MGDYVRMLAVDDNGTFDYHGIQIIYDVQMRIDMSVYSSMWAFAENLIQFQASLSNSNICAGRIMLILLCCDDVIRY